MKLEILSYPDPRLKQVCAPVGEITSEIRKLADDMLETMYEAPGVGLAAPQVGHFIRMLVMDPARSDEPKRPLVLINPELHLLGDDIVSEGEGCLSVPMQYRSDVTRKSQVHLVATGIDGKPIDVTWEGYPAIIVQHEADHLDGVLFIDRISRLRRSLFEAKLKKWLKHRSA